MKMCIVLTTDGYIPHVQLCTPDRKKAVDWAKDDAKQNGWGTKNVIEIKATKNQEAPGELYFNQKESGNMEYSITVVQIEVS